MAGRGPRGGRPRVGLPGLDEPGARCRAGSCARDTRWTALATLREFAAELRERRYDLSIDFHGVFRSGFLAWARGDPRAGRLWRRRSPRRRVTGSDAARAGAARVTCRASSATRALVRFLGGEVPGAPGTFSTLDGARAELGGAAERVRARSTPARARDDLQALGGRALRGGRAQRSHERASVRAWWRSAGGGRARGGARGGRGGGRRRARWRPRTESLEEFLAAARPSAPVRRLRLRAHAPGDPGGNARRGHLQARPTRSRTPPSRRIPARIVRRDVGCNPCREWLPGPRPACARVEPGAVIEAAFALLDKPRAGYLGRAAKRAAPVPVSVRNAKRKYPSSCRTTWATS